MQGNSLKVSFIVKKAQFAGLIPTYAFTVFWRKTSIAGKFQYRRKIPVSPENFGIAKMSGVEAGKTQS